ncbi:hypothetical protein CO174_04275 [Candidatus Uhrbacteria bacterium CG_4_9_14_3_um_filter_50_9]|uniref:Uncharacterized protein n=1 Tax=Candidatus Uhrbacteria bacterium CG_4_9_14_3_um_filter_50_9 TaxID=1975035 RepID=A0A2M7XBX8_9BACT|nr:MAG: hypothetical protein CO174_04275 [Candidatus Uhrbacteria bacterium CG_4_9_14_3_um_filter_50_9]
MRKGGLLLARVGFYLDPFNNTMNYQSWDEMLDVRRVEMRVRVTVPRYLDEDGNPIDTDRKLKCGRWFDEGLRVGSRTINDPSKFDPHRMEIHIVAPSITAARDAFIDTITGKRPPTEVWLA